MESFILFSVIMNCIVNTIMLGYIYKIVKLFDTNLVYSDLLGVDSNDLSSNK